MKTNYSLGIIKPDAFKKKVYGKIINEILSKDFEIIKMKIDQLDEERARNFYLIHKDKKFFPDLINSSVAESPAAPAPITITSYSIDSAFDNTILGQLINEIPISELFKKLLLLFFLLIINKEPSNL